VSLRYAELDKTLKIREGSSTVSNEELESLKSQCQNREKEIMEEQKRSQKFQKELSDYRNKYHDLVDRYVFV